MSVDNDALFRCLMAPSARDFLQVVGWIDDQQALIGPVQASGLLASNRLGPTALGGAKKSASSRALMLPDGQLYVPRVQLRDANKSYRCQVKNLLNSRQSLSPLSGRLFVTGEYCLAVRSWTGHFRPALANTRFWSHSHAKANSLICARTGRSRAETQ